MRYTPEEVAELLKDKPHQPHYIAAMVRKAVEDDREGRVMEWQPIETAPRDGTAILAWDGEDQTTIKWLETASYWTLCVPGMYAADGEFLPTHWEPLPAPPGGSDA